jgi:hypothetical protein
MFFFGCIVILFSSCSKSGSSNSSSNWSVNGTNYTAATVTYIATGGEANLSAAATGQTATYANGLVFTFLTAPVSSEQVLITDSMDPNTAFVTVTKLSGTTFTSYMSSTSNTKVSINLANNKVSATFSGALWLHNVTNYSDSVKLTVAKITQN